MSYTPLYRSALPLRSQQTGFVLAITLILISVMLVVGVTALRITGNEETMAGNRRDATIAYQAAEAALKNCELRMVLFDAKSGDFSLTYSNYVLHEEDPVTNGKYYWERGLSFWNDNMITKPYVGPASNPMLEGVVMQPRCMLEKYTIPPEETQEIVELVPAYKITSRGYGARNGINGPASSVFLQVLLRL